MRALAHACRLQTFMRSLALRGSPRQWLAKLHRWSGLAVLAFLLIASLTGSWLAYRHEMDRWINPELRLVQPRSERVSLSEVYARVERRFPDGRVTTAVLQEKPDDALVVYLASKTGTELPFNQIYVDPYTGQILGQRSTTRLRFTKEYLDPFILRIHYSLLLERSGLVFMGVVAIVWFLSNLIGVALSWPHAWRRLVAWIPILSVRARGGAYKVNYDLHRAMSMALLPILIVLAFTSIALNLPEVVRPAVNAFSPITTRPPARIPQLDAQRIVGPDRAVARAMAAVPGGRVTSIFGDVSRAWYSVLLRRDGDVAPYGDHFVYIDFATGDVAALRLAEERTAGDSFLAWQFPLHTGLAFGRAGQAVIAITGLCLVAISVTGFYVWWRKWRERRSARARATAVRSNAPVEQTELDGTRVAARERVVLESGRSM
jgi:uncharacterized iron-regulated membrane protein